MSAPYTPTPEEIKLGCEEIQQRKVIFLVCWESWPQDRLPTLINTFNYQDASNC